MKRIKIDKLLDSSDVEQINYLSKNEQIIIVMDSTKKIKKELLLQANDNIVFSITGGLNPIKQKFNCDYYQGRTYYSKQELYYIIGEFEKIERKINPTWSDLERAMFVYKSICESMIYGENELNYRDASRNLLGLITKQSVCAGLSIIFKEAMNRIGIECIYQNKRRHHSWNILKINEEYYGIDLTWDVVLKEEGKCKFRYFGREDVQQFYGNIHHNISEEREEREYKLKTIPEYTLEQMNKKMNKKVINKIENSSHKQIVFKSGKKLILSNGKYVVQDSKEGININNTFTREDGTSFTLIKNKSANGLIEYGYIEYSTSRDSTIITKIYSEMDLITNNLNMRNKIANNLLSRDRVINKIKKFNGYVGFVTENSPNRYYNPNIEQKLGINR